MLYLCSGRLDHATIWNAGRASRFTTTASETQLEMVHIRRRDRRTIGDLVHLIDSTAWRIHFYTQFAVCGASIEAQTAVHAFVQIGLRGTFGASRTTLEKTKFGHTSVSGSKGFVDRTFA